MKRITVGFIFGFVFSLLLYRLITKHHENILEIVRNLPKTIKFDLDKEVK